MHVHMLPCHALLQVSPRAGHSGALVGSTWYILGGGNNVNGAWQAAPGKSWFAATALMVCGRQRLGSPGWRQHVKRWAVWIPCTHR